MSERTMRSLRYAARSLARTPRFTVVAVFTVALAVGADTAIFSVVNGVLLRPLDYPDPDELVNVWSTAPGLGYDEFPLSPDVYFFYKSESSAFADMGLYSRADVSVTGEGEPERVPALSATASLFSTLGVAPVLGRTYTDQLSASRVEAAIREALEIHRVRYRSQVVPEAGQQAALVLLGKIQGMRGLRNKIAHFCWTRSTDDEIFGTALSGGLPGSAKHERSYVSLTTAELEQANKAFSTVVDELSSLVSSLPEVTEEDAMALLRRENEQPGT